MNLLKTISKTLSVALLLSISSYAFGQINLQDYAADWEGELPDGHAFSFEIRLTSTADNHYSMLLNFGSNSIEKTTSLDDKNKLDIDFGEGVSFSGQLNSDKTRIDGFMKSGFLFYRVRLDKGVSGDFVGNWNLFMVEEMQPATAFLAFEAENNGNYGAYTVFGDSRFAGTWAGGFTSKGNELNFADGRTGLRFHGFLEPDNINLDVFLAGKKLFRIAYKRSTEPWKQGTTANDQAMAKSKEGSFSDGWEVLSLENAGIDEKMLTQMEADIFASTLTFTHAVSIAKGGKLVYDRYFYGNHQGVTHDQRSAAKSYASAAVGIAIADGLFTGTDQKLYSQIPSDYQYTVNDKKASISIEDLLTMSSGLDAIDFGLNRNSAASEGAYQSSGDWLKTVLEAPMIYKPGEHHNYGSANPYLLGVMLDQVLEESLESYIDRKLFGPLGIQNYIIQSDLSGKPYFGGGWFLSPRDMLKFGQLYLNKGKWKGSQIISEEWVRKSFKKYGVLENTNDKNEYGYFWWHKTYTVDGKEIESMEARGSGGQYIFVVPSLDLVVAITSGNFRNGRFAQPEQIMEKYILPAVLEKR